MRRIVLLTFVVVSVHGCGNSGTSSVAPAPLPSTTVDQPTPCFLTSTRNIPAEGQRFYVLVQCSVFFQGDVRVDVPWVHLLGTSGAGSLMDVRVDVNTGAERTGHFTTAHQQVTFIQAAGNCVTAIAPSGQTFDENGGTGVFTVTGVPGCAWDATVYDDISPVITPQTVHGSGNGIILFNVPVYAETYGRSPYFVIGGTLRFQITQSACPTSVSPVDLHAPAAGGHFSTSVTGRSICHWTDYAIDRQMIARDFEDRTGPGTVEFGVAPNLTGKSRFGWLYVAGKTVVVTQDP